MSPPSGVILAPNSQSCAFNFPPRPQVSLSPQGNVFSPPTNGALPVSGASTVVNHSPGRSPNVGDAMNVEASVPHVSSTGTSEHAEFRNVTANDTGSEMSASSPHVLLREVCYWNIFVLVMKSVILLFSVFVQANCITDVLYFVLPSLNTENPDPRVSIS